MAPCTVTSEVGPVCCGQMHSGRWCSPVLCTRVCPSLACRQNLLSSLKTTECHSTLQSTLSQHQSSCSWRYQGVSGLAWGTRDLNPAASRMFQMVLGDTEGATRSDAPLINCAQQVQQSVDMFIQIPSCLQCYTVQMTKLRQQVQDAWDNLS